MEQIESRNKMREEVEKLVYKEMFLKKIMAINTFYINLSSDKAATGSFNNFECELKSQHRNRHIRNALFTIETIKISSVAGNFGTNQNSTRMKVNVKISHLRNNVYGHQAIAGANTGLDLVAQNKFYPTITLKPIGFAKTADIVNIQNSYPGPAVIGENPFGSTLGIELFNTNGAAYTNSTSNDAVATICLKVELIPDFCENDRMTY